MQDMKLSAAEIRELNLTELGEFYEIPAWTWQGVPIRGAGCLRSSLTDMISYTQAALRAGSSVSPECRSTASTPPPDVSTCLKGGGEDGGAGALLRVMGYGQQRQRVRGNRIPFQCKNFEDVGSNVEMWIAQGKKNYGPFRYFLNGVLTGIAGATLSPV